MHSSTSNSDGTADRSDRTDRASPSNGSPSNGSPSNASPSNASPSNASPSNADPLGGDHLHVPARPVPGGRWGLPWLVALVLTTSALLSIEAFVRARGYRPTVTDDRALWALERMRASDGGAHALAVLGSSRIELAWSSAAAHEVLSPPNADQQWNIRLLAVEGSAPVSVLRSLAADESFRGVALVDIVEPHFFKKDWPRSGQYVKVYNGRWSTPGLLAERWLATQVQARVAMLRAGGRRTIDALVKSGRWPDPPAVTTFADRSRVVDYTPRELAKVRARTIRKIERPKPASADRWIADVRVVDEAVRKIQARGGKVVFVRMPTCDERWVADEEYTPKAQFWDRLSKESAATLVHFQDEPTLAAFPCSDTSHIHSKDAPAFTRALLDVLKARGVLPRSSDHGAR